jgi:hypothetical protein
MVAESLNYSRKTIYQALDFLKKVNLVKLVEKRTGRGQHSKYQLTWLKPKKCHPKQQVVNKDLHTPCDARASVQNKLDGRRWGKAMRAFRLLVEESRLEKPQKRFFVQVIGSHLKGKTAEYAKRLYEELKTYISKIRVKKWVKNLKDLAKWGMGLIRFLMGYRWQSSRELKRREASERQADERWAQWLEKSENEHQQWLEQIMAAPIPERLKVIEESLEIWVAIRASLDGVGPSEEEKQLKIEWLKSEYGLARLYS